MRLRALLTPASSGALVTRVRAGRDGQPAGRPGGPRGLATRAVFTPYVMEKVVSFGPVYRLPRAQR